MSTIDSDIYVIHNAFSDLKAHKKIPSSINYEQWCKQLRDLNGRIYVKDNKGVYKYMVKYNPIDYLSIPDDAYVLDINEFKGLSEKIPYTDFNDFLVAKNENRSAVAYTPRVGYSISYDYETDDETNDYDFPITNNLKCIKLPHVSKT